LHFNGLQALRSIRASGRYSGEIIMGCCFLGWLLIAAVLSPSIASAVEPDGEVKERVRFFGFIPDEDIRQKLLTHTPPGCSPGTVLSFVQDSLRPKRIISAYSDYLTDYENAAGKQIRAVPITGRSVSAVVSEYPVGIFVSTQVRARWQFDENHHLTDIVVDRRSMGP
jgi:hypothetical protein